jgi:Tfp pilus assembly protein PilX
MVFALLVLLAILTLGVAGLSAASFGLTLANNYRTGIQAMQAAESGIVHALGVINANGGITTFGDATSNTGAYDWTTFSCRTSCWSTPTSTMPGYSNISYTITPSSDPDRDPGGTNSGMRMLLTSAGQAPGESQRTLKAHLGLVGPFTCGAIDLPSTGIDSTFNGNSFLVNGTDYDPTTGLPATNGMAPTLGISTRTQADADGIVTALGNSGIDNVVGMAVGPNMPSVGTCTGPDVNRVRDEIVPNILNLPCATASPSCLATNPALNGNDTFGTMASPQITHYTGDLTIPQHGTMQGAGVLIVDGGLTINGDVDFTGLIIVRGTTQFDTDLSGHARIYGAVWTTNLQLTVAGNAQALYSSQALSMVNSVLGQNQVLPQHATLLAWSE